MAADGNIVKLCLNNGPVDSPGALSTQNVVKNILGASIVYIMNTRGLVISSTKFTGGRGTLTGENYIFRPYFTNAMKGGHFIYGAIGVTTLERGVYFSSPVKDPITGKTAGVAVIKMGLEIIDGILSGLPAKTAIVSPEGIIFSSNVKDWQLRSIYPVDDEMLGKLEETKQFAGMAVSEVESRNYFRGINEYIGGTKYRVAFYPFYLYDWKIIMIEESSKIAPITPLQRSVIISLAAVIISILLIIYLSYINKYTAIALKQYESNYMQIYESVNDAIFIHDAANGSVLDVNKRTVEMFGFSREEYIGAGPKITDVGDPEYSSEKALEHIKKAIAGEPQLFEWKTRKKSGEIFWTEINLKSAFITGKKVVLAVVRDINSRKNDEQKMRTLVADLQRSNTELQEFAYVASHDLKEPLRMVSSYVQLLAKRYSGKLGKDADDFIAFASGGAKQMQNLIEDLLAYSRVGTKGREPVAVETSVIVERLETNMKFQIDEKNGILNYAGLPRVKADVTQLEQLFMNLISNALKFSDKNRPSVIYISAEKEGNMWKFRVKDNGIGIDKKYFDKIFVIFQKLHSKEEYEGTGIGLSICKKIVELHGGNIWIESEQNKGTSVYFTLPAAS